jgi:predicted outer membrane protein
MKVNLIKALSIASLAALAIAGCGDDDDDDGGIPDGGGTSAGRGGTSAGRGGTQSQAGAPDGQPQGGAATGGTGNEAGAPNMNGDAGAAGGDAGGATGGGAAGADAGGMAGGAGDGAGGMGVDVPDVSGLTDAQILLVADTLNEGEVNQAVAAFPRLTVPAVEDYADLMIAHHTEAREDIAALAQTLNIVPAPSSVRQELRAEAEAGVEMLLSSPADALDLPYIDLQLIMHAQGEALTEALIAAADSAQIDALLSAQLVLIRQHLELARELQAELD